MRRRKQRETLPSILAGIDISGLLAGPRPDYVPEPECEAWACDDGAQGDSNCVSCDLPPGHDGMHRDSRVKVMWCIPEERYGDESNGH